MILKFFRIFYGPRLFRIYQDGNKEGKVYEANTLETIGDNVLKSISVICSLGIYTSPLIIGVLFKRGYLCTDGFCTLSRCVSAFSILLFGAYILRGIGRYANSEYMKFLSVLENAHNNLTRDTKLVLRRYDFEFHSWPVEFEATKGPRLHPVESRRKQPLEVIWALPCQILSYLAIHTIGRRMIYPGSVGLMQAALRPMLMDGRAQLIEEHEGERFKILTSDNNQIDTLVVDRRKKSDSPNGNTLVICCEGNAGFYEYGTMSTPLAAGYSVLGWNHPGFGGSTGLPYPDQEVNAINAVMEFAMKKLHFSLENVIIFAWSIGGYTATWAAMTNPKIKGLILDATFDKLIPLALCRMPQSWKPLVIRTIKDYMNLNNADHIVRYPGPVLLIRRTQDEMISTEDSHPIQSNRGNELLIILLQKRFPRLFNSESLAVLKDWLAGDRNHQVIIWNENGVDEDMCLTTLRSYLEEQGSSYPVMLGEDMPQRMKNQMVLYLARKHMIDFNSTHCTPLPPSLFQIPWNITDVQNGMP